MKKEFYHANAPESMMRLMAIRTVNTAVFVASLVVIGAVAGVILSVVLNRDLTTIGGFIGALLAGSAGIIGTLLIPAFGGKAVQSFAENAKSTAVNTQKPMEEEAK